MDIDSEFGPLFTPGQYDLTVIDTPTRARKPRPEADLAQQMMVVFAHEGKNTVYQSARKVYNEVGTELGRRGLDALAKLPGWTNAIIKYGVKSMTQVTRIVQAASLTDDNDRPPVAIQVEMGRRQALLENADQELVAFLQELHGTHPAMRRHIKSAAEQVLKAAFQTDVERAPALVGATLQIARKDAARIKSIRESYKIPKETAVWLVQILTRL